MIKKEHDYKEIIREINRTLPNYVNEIITLDVQRTFFDQDTDKKRNVGVYY